MCQTLFSKCLLIPIASPLALPNRSIISSKTDFKKGSKIQEKHKKNLL